MSNGEKATVEPVTDAQALLSLVVEVDRLARQLEKIVGGALERLGQEIGEIRAAVEGNQEKLRAMNNTLGDLGTAANLALRRLPPHGAAAAPRSELAARIRAARSEEAILLGQLQGGVFAPHEEIAARIDSLGSTYQAVIGEMDRLLHEESNQEENTPESATTHQP